MPSSSPVAPMMSPEIYLKICPEVLRIYLQVRPGDAAATVAQGVI